jgi:hypothetical protein
LPVFLYTAAWLVAFVLVGVVYLTNRDFRSWVPSDAIMEVGWWGGLGGVLANFETIARTVDDGVGCGWERVGGGRAAAGLGREAG